MYVCVTGESTWYDVIVHESLIIISTHNRPGGLAMLKRLLESLTHQEEKAFDVLVLQCKNFTSTESTEGDFPAELRSLLGSFTEHFPVRILDPDTWDRIADQANSALLKRLTFDTYSGFRNIGLAKGLMLQYRNLCFLDDDEEKIGRNIHGVPVLGPRKDIEKIARHSRVNELIIAIPRLSKDIFGEVVDSCRSLDISCKKMQDILPK